MPSGIYKNPEVSKRKHRESMRRNKNGFKKGNQCALGHKHSNKTKKMLREAKMGDKNPSKRLEVRNKISESLRGEKCHWWQGGISFKPYTIDWTQDLKRAIRKRDKYTCQICGKEPALDCHHIDYDKKNCNSDNLITLCHSCHSRTNGSRVYWQNYFQGQSNKK